MVKQCPVSECKPPQVFRSYVELYRGTPTRPGKHSPLPKHAYEPGISLPVHRVEHILARCSDLRLNVKRRAQ